MRGQLGYPNHGYSQSRRIPIVVDLMVGGLIMNSEISPFLGKGRDKNEIHAACVGRPRAGESRGEMRAGWVPGKTIETRQVSNRTGNKGEHVADRGSKRFPDRTIIQRQLLK